MRIHFSRWIAMTLWLAAFGVVIIMQRMVLIVTFEASPAILLQSYIFTGVSFLLSWVISMMYKSNRDTAIDEMGHIELKMFQAAIEEQLNHRARNMAYEPLSGSKPKGE